MKILFICGSLEPGKDGVGDYSFKLAAELKNSGHQIMLVALNDRHAKVLVENTSDEISAIRFPGSMGLAQRFKILQQSLDSFKPDWITLQFVGYSFQKRAMPFAVARQMKKMVIGAKVHIMFHEIWLGDKASCTWKEKIAGFFQKRATLAVVNALKPVCISTTNEYYQKCLLKAGISANKIPVFSNMPLGDPAGKKIYKQLPVDFLNNSTNYVLASFFGGFHNHDQLALRIKQLSVSVKVNLNKNLIISHIGKDTGIEEQFDKLNSVTGVTMRTLGEWPENDIADYLSICDLSLTNQPKILFEKSGSVAAALYNKCPVVILSDSFAHHDQPREEVKELSHIDDIGKFISQDTDFFINYGTKRAAEQYSTIFNR